MISFMFYIHCMYHFLLLLRIEYLVDQETDPFLHSIEGLYHASVDFGDVHSTRCAAFNYWWCKSDRRQRFIFRLDPIFNNLEVIQ